MLDLNAAEPVALVVDDDPAYRMLIRQYLEPAGFAVIVVGNARLALHVLEERPVSVLVTDLVMPEIGGLELIELVKRGFPRVRIVAVSGSGAGFNEGYLRTARLVGADVVLRKPFSGSGLLQAVMSKPEASVLPAM
jgi:CheY-like chemotaxis protein